MPVTYPVNMPVPLVKGYSAVDDTKFRKDKIKQSPLKYRKLTDTGSMVIKAQWSLNALEFQVFEGWYRHDLYYGSKSFDMNIKINGGSSSHTFYFPNSYITTMKGKLFIVNASLLALDKNYDDLATYEAARDSLAGV
jgi:tellurite resistance-related uncharacterized protein